MAIKKTNIEDTQDLDVSEINQIYEQEQKQDSSNITNIIIGVIVAILFVMLLFVGWNLVRTISKDSNTSTNSSTSEVIDADEDTSTSTEITENGLSQYKMQSANSVILNILNNKYGTDGYTRPAITQYKVTGSEDEPTIMFKLALGKMTETHKIVDAEFKLIWDDEFQKYTISDYMIDNENAEISDFESHSTEKEMEEQAQSQTEMTGREVSNYNINVRNSITVTITATGSGNVTAYAISKDGKNTELAAANNTTVSNTVSLEAGEYKLVLYAEEGAGYHWEYKLN